MSHRSNSSSNSASSLRYQLKPSSQLSHFVRSANRFTRFRRKGHEAVLTDDPKRLRIFGIDLHSRGRRRVIVALTYVVYVFAMAAVEVAFDAKHENSDRKSTRLN